MAASYPKPRPLANKRQFRYSHARHRRPGNVFLKINEALIARLHMAGTAIIVAALVLVMGLLSIRQIRQEYDSSSQALQLRDLQRHQEFLREQMTVAQGFLTHMRTHTEQVLKDQIREQVDEAYAMAAALYAREHGHRSDAAIRALIVEALRPLRFFNGKGYFFVDGLDGRCLLLPIAPEREGSSLLLNRDDKGALIMQGLIKAAETPAGQGFVRYRWYAPNDPAHMADKISYVRAFAPLHLLIGSGQYVQDVEAALQRQALDWLRTYRFGTQRRGYFLVYSADGRVLLSPSRPSHEGLRLSALPPDGRAATRLIEEQADKGGGFVRYDWSADGNPAHTAPKLVYVGHLPGWNWTLAAGEYMEDFQQTGAEQQAALQESIRGKIHLTVMVLAVGVAVALLLGWWFATLTRQLLARYQADIDRRTRELGRKTAALEQSNTDLEQFAYVASHDLREPLRSISAYITLIERQYGQSFDADGRLFLSFVRDGAKRMDRLVLDLLQFSRIDRLGDPIRPMSAAAALDEALQALAVAITETGAVLELDPAIAQAAVLGDFAQIERLFQNLIGNALKYRSPERPLRIAVTLAETRDDERAYWEFSVHDNGQGIEPASFERIFGIFQRLHSRDYEGTGIGLAVCKRIVERHGGRLWLDSTPGQGSRFYFTLPQAEMKDVPPPSGGPI